MVSLDLFLCWWELHYLFCCILRVVRFILVHDEGCTIYSGVWWGFYDLFWWWVYDLFWMLDGNCLFFLVECASKDNSGVFIRFILRLLRFVLGALSTYVMYMVSLQSLSRYVERVLWFILDIWYQLVILSPVGACTDGYGVIIGFIPNYEEVSSIYSGFF